MLTELLQEILLTESVSVADIDDAIDNHKRVIINYHSKGEDVATGARVIEVYAYGTTKAGNPVIRAFQPYGDTTSKIPSWKFFRLDRISAWEKTNQIFNTPASEIYKGIGDFNPDGDLTMSTVYKIAKFGNEENDMDDISLKTNPKLKDDLFKTPTERNMERLRQQVINPIKLSDIKTKNGFKDYSKPNNETGPKLKPSAERKIPVNTEENEPSEEELDDLRRRLGDTSGRITMKDLNDRLAGKKTPEETSTDELRKESDKIKQ